MYERLRNMFMSNDANIRGGMQAQLDEIDERSGVKSSLQVIGMAVVHPMVR